MVLWSDIGWCYLTSAARAPGVKYQLFFLWLFPDLRRCCCSFLTMLRTQRVFTTQSTDFWKKYFNFLKKRSAANRISLIAEQQQEPQLEFQQKHVLTTEKKERKEKDVSGSSFFFLNIWAPWPCHSPLCRPSLSNTCKLSISSLTNTHPFVHQHVYSWHDSHCGTSRGCLRKSGGVLWISTLTTCQRKTDTKE